MKWNKTKYFCSHNSIPAGCSSIICAHGRSWEIYSESVYPGNEYGFMSVECTSRKSLNAGKCNGTKYPMGYLCPTDITGHMYLNTNSKPPYGLASLPLSKVVCSSRNPKKVNIVY